MIEITIDVLRPLRSATGPNSDAESPGQADDDVDGDVRGRGLLIGVDLVKDRSTREPAADLAEAVMYGALDRGLSFKTTMGNVLTLTPPLITTEDQMTSAFAIIEDAISANG